MNWLVFNAICSGPSCQSRPKEKARAVLRSLWKASTRPALWPDWVADLAGTQNTPDATKAIWAMDICDIYGSHGPFNENDWLQYLSCLHKNLVIFQFAILNHQGLFGSNGGSSWWPGNSRATGCKNARWIILVTLVRALDRQTWEPNRFGFLFWIVIMKNLLFTAKKSGMWWIITASEPLKEWKKLKQMCHFLPIQSQAVSLHKLWPWQLGSHKFSAKGQTEDQEFRQLSEHMPWLLGWKLQSSRSQPCEYSPTVPKHVFTRPSVLEIQDMMSARVDFTPRQKALWSTTACQAASDLHQFLFCRPEGSAWYQSNQFLFTWGCPALIDHWEQDLIFISFHIWVSNPYWSRPAAPLLGKCETWVMGLMEWTVATWRILPRVSDEVSLVSPHSVTLSHFSVGL